ncbi:MAG: hypothetical protein ABSA48_11085 [Terracidiphilus sp.]|jgi:hypothetical protein
MYLQTFRKVLIKNGLMVKHPVSSGLFRAARSPSIVSTGAASA